jgi:hypothetical protein
MMEPLVALIPRRVWLLPNARRLNAERGQCAFERSPHASVSARPVPATQSGAEDAREAQQLARARSHP